MLLGLRQIVDDDVGFIFLDFFSIGYAKKGSRDLLPFVGFGKFMREGLGRSVWLDAFESAEKDSHS